MDAAGLALSTGVLVVYGDLAERVVRRVLGRAHVDLSGDG
jgi:hypothetical protein